MHRKFVMVFGVFALIFAGVSILWFILGDSTRDALDSGMTDEGSRDPSKDGEPSCIEALDRTLRRRVEPIGLEEEAESPKEPAHQEASGTEAPHTFLVQGEYGEPVSGAIVRLFRRSIGNAIQEVTSLVTGAAVIQSARPGDEIEAVAKDYLLTRISLQDRPWPNPYLITLHKAKAQWRGDIVDDLEQRVEGAKVIMLFQGGRAAATTAKDGSFYLGFREPPQIPLEARFQVFHPDYCFLGQDVLIAIEHWDKDQPLEKYAQAPVLIMPQYNRMALMVHRWAKLRVEALDPEGRPLSDLRACLAGPPGVPNRRSMPCGSDAPLRLHSREKEKAEEACQGEGLLIEKVPPLLPLWLIVEHPLYESVEKELGAFEPAQERAVMVQFIESRRIKNVCFQVVDPKGNPLAGARVGIAYERVQDWLCTDEEGNFSLAPKAGEFEVSVSIPGFALYRRTYSSHDFGPEKTTIMLEPSNAEIVVMMQDQQGVPLPDITLRITELGNKKFDIVARTNGEGLVKFSGLDLDSRYQICVGRGSPGNYFWNRDRNEVPSPAILHDMRPGDRDLVIRLVPPASIGGRVRIAGTAHKQVSLSLVDATTVERFFTVGGDLGPEGEFLFTGLPPGRYHLWMETVEWSGKHDHPIAVWDLAAGEKMREVEVTKNR